MFHYGVPFLLFNFILCLLYFGQFLEFLSDSQGQWKHLRHQYKIYWDTFRPAGAAFAEPIIT